MHRLWVTLHLLMHILMWDSTKHLYLEMHKTLRALLEQHANGGYEGNGGWWAVQMGKTNI